MKNKNQNTTEKKQINKENKMSSLQKEKFVRGVAKLVTVLFALVIMLQLLLASGLLPASIAWGGRQTEAAAGLQIANLVAVIVLSGFIYIIRYRAGLVGSSPIPKAIRIGSWVVAGFMVLNTLGNLASVNAVEKFLFAPLTLVLAIACFIISASKVGQTNQIEEGIRQVALK
jgi:hypothetical protein